MEKWIQIHPKDNVVVALSPLSKGEIICLENREIQAQEDIPQGHKIALTYLSKGDKIYKYGYPIGAATTGIAEGSWVHTHNVKTLLGDLLSYQYEPDFKTTQEKRKDYFQGYQRENGKVGVRNEIWIIPTVGCVNGIAEMIARQCRSLVQGSIEDIVAFPHPYGCSQLGDDQENTRTVLADLVNHPNAGGVLVLGLGCENSNIPELKKYIGDYNPDRVKFLISQESEDEVSDAVNLIHELADYASQFQREPISAEHLIIGTKCGGSDGLSGITANPLVGQFSNKIIAAGGTSILTEVPEMFGAETILMNRCQNKEIFQKTVGLINNFKKYFQDHNQNIYENPSPGNKAGGITTLEDKSLGCTQKAGDNIVTDVLEYGQPVQTKGLNLLNAPGNDLVASTALVASGAHIVLFTTGRGTPFASPAPTVKISSNTPLYESKKRWIDFNAGQLVSGKPMDELAEEFYQYILAVASGKKVKSEELGLRDMAIFKQGVTL